MVGLYRHRNPSHPSAQYDVNDLGLSSIPLNPFRAPSGGGNLNKHRATYCLVTFQGDLFNPSNAKATPIYLLVLRAQEVGNEPFWNKKKVEKCDFFYLFYFVRVCRLGLVAICFYQPILN